MNIRQFLGATYLVSWLGVTGVLAEDERAFFESHIRPVLVEQCYRCHNSSNQADGGLALDFQGAVLEGGDGGEILTPGKPEASRLLAILKHEVPNLRMPKGAAKLDASVISDFEQWIARGAFDPRSEAPTEESLARETSIEAQLERRKLWWSFQPVRRVEPPVVQNRGWSNHPVDRFLLATLEEKGLKPSSQEDRHALLRRAYFTLTGLPPTPEESLAFLQDSSPESFENLIDRLLDSPRFGERWARHWMDVVRYCESHGSQGDPELANAYRYRDYLIRAFNSDVPYNQFVREHLAGDLLDKPRLDPAGEVNESALGTAQLRMVEFGYIPVDALEDQVKVVDNQIDVFSKSFLGLTVSCARCHDHKFDAISQKDFYALYGVFASCRPGQISIDAPGKLARNKDQLAEVKQQIRIGLAEAWQSAVPVLVEGLKRQEQIALERKNLEGHQAQVFASIAAIEGPAELAILEARGQQSARELPRPMARWSFAQDARDSFSGLNGIAEGNAVYRNGRLVLDGKDVRVRSGPLTKDIREKTLEAWVSLANLEQRGVGVIAIESDEGARFDAIVYNDVDQGVWIAGSDFFNRTQGPGGPVEQAGPDQLIHLAIVYRDDNSITLYRDGKPYGTAYTRGTLQTFESGKARVLIGQRHPMPGISRLAGEIDEVRLYDRPLTANEVSASFQAGPGGVTREELIKSLGPEDAMKFEDLLADATRIQAQLVSLKQNADGLTVALERVPENSGSPFRPWVELMSRSQEEYPGAWESLRSQWETEHRGQIGNNKFKYQPGWNLTSGDLAKWFGSGTGPIGVVSTGGEFCIEREGEKVLRGIYPSGVYSHTLSRKHNGMLTSPRFVIETDRVSIRALGENSSARLVIENYALGGGGIYPATRLNRDEMAWVTLDTSYRKGAHAYVEFQTDNNDRAGFGAAEVVFHDGGEPPREVVLAVDALIGSKAAAPGSRTELAERYGDVLREAIAAFKSGAMSAEQTAFLDYFLRNGLLPVTLDKLTTITKIVGKYRELERDVPLATQAPGVHEAEAFDQELFTRGRHTQPSEPVARRFLQALGGTPYLTRASGRLELADEVVSPANPLTSRVIVNRLWQHVFGKGLVGTVDNFGRLGNKPTHPELLDYLASRFMAEDSWSIKRMLRFLMTSQAYQQTSNASEQAQRIDGGNNWLSHMNLIRLEAEVIRDSILATSGQLDLSRMYGPGVDVYFVTKTEGGGPKGPLDGDRRRSIYQRIRRNAQNPFLEVFDAPKPTTTRGQRDVTNVPAQSLTLMNDPFVIDQAAKWATSLVASNLSVDQRIAEMFLKGVAREPLPLELNAARRFLTELAGEHGVTESEIPGSKAIWQDLAQAIFCLKEFIYVD